jgi:hypothetical protein
MATVAPGSIGGALRGFARPGSLAIALAALSFAIYVCTMFALPQVRNARYCCEQESLAAAVSNVMYRSPLGSLYVGVYDYLVNRMDQPLEQVLKAARTPGVGLPASPPGELKQTTRDGIGVGYPLIATAAFRLFGLHAWSLTVTMLILMAVSAAAFLVRFFGAAFVGVVILYFSTLTVMLFTRLASDPHFAEQIPVAGVRYFSLVSVLPIFYILLTLLDAQPTQPGTGRWNAVLLGLQTLILTLTMLVRGSAFALIGAIALVCLAFAWRHRRNRGRLLALFGNLALIGLVIVGVFAAIALSVPRGYLAEGRFGPLVWHRVTVSLGTSPAWPFAGVNEMFDCRKQFPEGIEGGMPDTNGHCIFFDYLSKHNIAAEKMADELYGKLYETALREAFFKIAARDPGDVLRDLFYYKPEMIVQSIAQSVGIPLGEELTGAQVPRQLLPYPSLALGLLLVSLGVAFAHFSIGAVPMQALRQIAGLTLLSALFTIPAYLAAWAMPDTSADLLFYCLFAIGLALAAILVSVRRALRIPMSAPMKGLG